MSSQFTTIRDLLGWCDSHDCNKQKEKRFLCEQSLIICGYNIPPKTDVCAIYRELVELKSIVKKRSSETDYIHMTTPLNNLCHTRGSEELKRFLIFNNHRPPTPPPSVMRERLLSDTVIIKK